MSEKLARELLDVLKKLLAKECMYMDDPLMQKTQCSSEHNLAREVIAKAEAALAASSPAAQPPHFSDDVTTYSSFGDAYNHGFEDGKRAAGAAPGSGTPEYSGGGDAGKPTGLEPQVAPPASECGFYSVLGGWQCGLGKNHIGKHAPTISSAQVSLPKTQTGESQ